MKKQIKIYLEPADEKKFREKAGESGFVGRGSLTKFCEKIAREEICFLDDNLKKMLKVLYPQEK